MSIVAHDWFSVTSDDAGSRHAEDAVLSLSPIAIRTTTEESTPQHNTREPDPVHHTVGGLTRYIGFQPKVTVRVEADAALHPVNTRHLVAHHAR